MSDASPTGLQGALALRLVGVFDSGLAERRAYFLAHPEERPRPEAVEAIIAKYAYLNAGIAGALSLVPGPLGMLAVLPEIVLIVRNQVRMVYDIAVAYDKGDVASRELVVGLALGAAGSSGLGLVAMHGGRFLIKRPALRVMQRLVSALAGRLTQRVIRSAVARWVPLLGAAAMAVWSKMSTASIGRQARDLFSQPLELEPLEDDGWVGEDVHPTESSAAAVEQKVRVLANLMKADGASLSVELAYLDAILAGARLSPAVDAALRAELAAPNQGPVDLAPFRADPDEAQALLMDMVALAWRDGTLHPAEKAHIRRVARDLGVPDADVAVLLDE